MQDGALSGRGGKLIAMDFAGVACAEAGSSSESAPAASTNPADAQRILALIPGDGSE